MSRISLDKPSTYLCPRIKGAESDHIFFGGDQSWFPRNTAFKGGCGPVAGANSLTVYVDQHPQLQNTFSLSIDPMHFVSQEDYLALLEGIYHTMHPLELPILHHIYDRTSRTNSLFNKVPVTLGVNLWQYILGLKRFAKRKGVRLHHRTMHTMFCGYMRGLTFIKLALANGYPITMLTTGNRVGFTLYDQPYFQGGHSQTMKHHFVTITDIRESSDGSHNPELVITSWGKTGTISYADLHRSWSSPRSFGSAMVYFR